MSEKGYIGLIATNTISEGTTRELGLEPFFENGGSIFRAIDSTPWSGTAVVLISKIWASKSSWKGKFILNDKNVSYISSRLEPGEDIGEPFNLAKTFIAFHGTKPRGDFAIGLDELQINI